MNRFSRFLLLALAGAAAPAMAEDVPTIRHHQQVPQQLNQGEQDLYRSIFAALRSGNWIVASTLIDGAGDTPLAALARAELYLAKGSPRVEAPQLLALIAKAPDLPQAAQLARLAETRGVTDLPPLPYAQELRWAGSQPRRERARSVAKSAAAAELEPQISRLIVDDQPAAAEALLTDRELELAPEALTEFQQRIAWSHYLIGNDFAARQLADRARLGIGEWALQAEWVAGLAAWRMNDCNAAAARFATVGTRASDVELSAAGHYWASRAEMACRRPERVQASLKSAARMRETFYGLLAAGALGMKASSQTPLHDYRDSEWQRIAAKPNVRSAVALVQIGERSLAEDLIKHQARIAPQDHDLLVHLASDLDLASTQFWLAHNAPRGASVNPAARYPMPKWQPSRGWRVDPSLVFAHTLQESNFRTAVVSPAGATGLMQVRPGTAGDIARARGEPFDPRSLTEPSANMEFGQSYLEYLRDLGTTGGLLPKVIAAYNAGPSPVGEWNMRQIDRGDPLLYIESLPYWETRGYVPIVLRNYWIYEIQSGRESGSRTALAQGLWPRFPGLPGPRAVRMGTQPTQTASRGTE